MSHRVRQRKGEKDTWETIEECICVYVFFFACFLRICAWLVHTSIRLHVCLLPPTILYAKPYTLHPTPYARAYACMCACCHISALHTLYAKPKTLDSEPRNADSFV